MAVRSVKEKWMNLGRLLNRISIVHGVDERRKLSLIWLLTLYLRIARRPLLVLLVNFDVKIKNRD